MRRFSPAQVWEKSVPFKGLGWGELSGWSLAGRPEWETAVRGGQG